MAIFGEKHVSKGLQDDPKMVKVSLQFHEKNPRKINILVCGAHFTSRFVLGFS